MMSQIDYDYQIYFYKNESYADGVGITGNSFPLYKMGELMDY